ncbi:FHA domain-containing protein [bacterium]|nr:FHA domain-containing protein [bacterium]
MYGELQPLGGGDPIPLLKKNLTVGRRETVDVVLRFPNVSGAHCELSLVNGYWHVKDLGSSNGIKVNGSRVHEQRLDPGDRLSVASHDYEVAYEPSRLGAVDRPADHSANRGVFSRSLLEAAGLEARRSAEPKTDARRKRR